MGDLLPELAWYVWALLALSAFVVGASKTAVPAAATIAVAVFAAVLPARESTGTLLPLLITADMVAIISYRRHVEWRVLARMLPAVVVGLALGFGFLAVAGDDLVRVVIGGILLLVVGFTLSRRWLGRRVSEDGPHPVAAAAYGGLAGFTTMVANAAGPVVSMYFLAMRFPVKEFLGTAAWFFAIVNLAKVPFSAGLGLITVPGLVLDLVLVPAVLLGAFLGRRLASRMDQRVFDRLVIAFTIIGAVYLIVGA